MSTHSSRARQGGYGYTFPHQPFWERREQREQAIQRGTWQPAGTAQAVAYRYADGEQFYIAVNRNLLWVTVQRMEIPGGKPGYRFKAEGGTERKCDEETLKAQHDAANCLLRDIARRRVTPSVPRRMKQPDWPCQVGLSLLRECSAPLFWGATSLSRPKL